MKVTIVTTKFENLVNNPTGRVTYGVRVYDDQGHATYDNTMADALKDMPKGPHCTPNCAITPRMMPWRKCLPWPT